MHVRVKLSDRMAGDHGNHAPGDEVALPAHIARQVVEARHGIALDETPDETPAEVPTDDDDAPPEPETATWGEDGETAMLDRPGPARKKARRPA